MTITPTRTIDGVALPAAAAGRSTPGTPRWPSEIDIETVLQEDA